jgi:hypothetical protein
MGRKEENNLLQGAGEKTKREYRPLKYYVRVMGLVGRATHNPVVIALVNRQNTCLEVVHLGT